MTPLSDLPDIRFPAHSVLAGTDSLRQRIAAPVQKVAS
jgi:hypothetical protein